MNNLQKRESSKTCTDGSSSRSTACRCSCRVAWSSSSCKRQVILRQAFLWRCRLLHLRVNPAPASDGAMRFAQPQRPTASERGFLEHHGPETGGFQGSLQMVENHQLRIELHLDQADCRLASMPKRASKTQKHTCPFGHGSGRSAQCKTEPEPKQHCKGAAPAAQQSKLEQRSQAAKRLEAYQQPLLHDGCWHVRSALDQESLLKMDAAVRDACLKYPCRSMPQCSSEVCYLKVNSSGPAAAGRDWAADSPKFTLRQLSDRQVPGQHPTHELHKAEPLLPTRHLALFLSFQALPFIRDYYRDPLDETLFL